MAALQKFKVLATQCGVAQSPTRSPGVVLRRRKTTLRMLLSRTRSPRHRDMPLPPSTSKDAAGRSLRDLFVSSPPPFQHKNKADPKVRIGPGSPRPGWIGFRNRSLLRKVWRPVLVGIPE